MCVVCQFSKREYNLCAVCQFTKEDVCFLPIYYGRIYVLSVSFLRENMCAVCQLTKEDVCCLPIYQGRICVLSASLLRKLCVVCLFTLGRIHVASASFLRENICAVYKFTKTKGTCVCCLSV